MTSNGGGREGGRRGSPVQIFLFLHGQTTKKKEEWESNHVVL